MRVIFADEYSEIDEETWNYILAKYEKNFAPIIHAHIITNWLGDSRCSNCGQNYIDINSKYCLECGARFDEPKVDEGRFGDD